MKLFQEAQFNNVGEIRINIKLQDDFLQPSGSFLQIEGQLLKVGNVMYEDRNAIPLTNKALMYPCSKIYYHFSGQIIE